MSHLFGLRCAMIDYAGQFAKDFEQIRNSIQKPNILVLGPTGSGKSTLVNLVFGSRVAESGAGYPVTRGINTYRHQLINLFDSEGYESGQENQSRYRELIFDFIGNRSSMEERIHLVWYCLSLPAARFTDLDAEFLNGFRERKLPAALMLTQVDSSTEENAAEMKAAVISQMPGQEIFETTTDETLKAQLGFVDKIIDWSVEHLPESLHEALLSAVAEGLERKYDAGRKSVMKHAALAATIGAAPIPMADSPALIANQVTMVAHLASIWDLPKLDAMASSGLASTAVSYVGRGLAGNLVKIIPGVGTWLGGTINATVAAAVTTAMGLAVNTLCRNYVQASLEGRKPALESFFNAASLEALVKSYYKKGEF
ncbi:hypothetical protein C4J81_03325 [Deltaproteobacteria bacterium Smac51]|nr:hypothetical protein C4J81_03325 [Deltaproteobacteria bacterium Smac51]